MKVKRAMLGDMGNNCYLITDEESGESALIDCTDYSQKMQQLIAGANLKYILLTHGHFDHIGGLREVQNATGATVMVSEEDAPMLTSSKESLAAYCKAPHEDVPQYETFKDGDVIMLGSTKITVMATPGHTKGSVSFITGGYIFSGDTLFYMSCGRTDFPGGSVADMKRSLKKLAALKGDYKVCPGHDSETTLQFERAHNPYIEK